MLKIAREVITHLTITNDISIENVLTATNELETEIWIEK